MAGHELAAPRNPVSVMPSPAAMRRFQEDPCRDWSAGNICARTFGPCRGSKGYPAGFARGYGVLSCVVGKPQTERSAERCHGALMRKFHAFLEGNPDKPIYTSELTAVLGVSGIHAQLLSRTPRHAAKPLPDAPPHELRAPGVAKSRSCSHVRDRCRNRVWFLGAWPVRSGLQVGIWKIAFHDPAPKLRPVPGQPGAGERCCSQPSPAERHRSAVRPGDHLCTGRSLASTALNGFQDASG